MTLQSIDDLFMRRAIELSDRATRAVAMNPKVGCVIEYKGRIIGEGYHHKAGEHHAERMALAQVNLKEKALLASSTMYITLEPCNHHGKTPPCVDAIIQSQIKKVVVASEDPNPLMRGKSLHLLRSMGIEVITPFFEKEAKFVNRVFLTNQKRNRPHVVLKWAQSANGLIGHTEKQVWISANLSRIFAHRLRSEVDAILIGAGTALVDNPSLTNRLYSGNSPLRVLLDTNGHTPISSQILSDEYPSLIYSMESARSLAAHKSWVQLAPHEYNLSFILADLLSRGFYNVLVEGGAKILTSFIAQDLWDEAFIIHSSNKIDGNVKAPLIKGQIQTTFQLDHDKVYQILAP